MSAPDGPDELTATAARAAAAYVSLTLALTRRVTDRRSAAAHHAADLRAVSAPPPGAVGAARTHNAATAQFNGKGGEAEREPVSSRYTAMVRQVLEPDLATAVLADPGWSTLATGLLQAERTGADPARLLAQAAGEREMTTARRPALLLAHRLNQQAARAAEQPPDGPPSALPAPGQPHPGRSSQARDSRHPQLPAHPDEQVSEARSGRTHVRAVLARCFPTRLTEAWLRPGQRHTGHASTTRPVNVNTRPERRSWVLLLRTASGRRGRS